MSYKVLIAEDDLNFRYALRVMYPWEKEGFEIIGEAVHGLQALDILKSTPIDLLITDMSMPLLNGLELILKMKELNLNIPVLVLSAYDDFPFVKQSLKAGAMDYILKQELTPDGLTSTMEEVKKVLNSSHNIADFPQGKSPEITKTIQYIQEHYSEDLTLNILAEHVGLSPNYLSNLFKSEVSENLTTYINQIRIEKAQHLLRTTNMKVYEIAYAVGYNNPTYFSNIFKKITKTSVTEYKRSPEKKA